MDRPREQGEAMIDEVLGGDDWRTDLFDIDAYMRAIDLDVGTPTVEFIERLHRAHVRTFPFANVDVLLGTHPGVAPDRVQEQLVERHRGGYCFEHAQIFAAALERAGFEVRRALGRVHTLHNTRSHMSVLVRASGRWWLCDPGFGYSLTGPIELADGATREDGGSTHTITRTDDDGFPMWLLSRDGAVQHYLDELPVHPPDVRAAHFVTSEFEHSGFKQRLMIARHLEGEHVTLTHEHRTVRVPGRATEQQQLGLDEVLGEIERLGVILRDAEVDELTRVLERLRERPGG